MSVSFYRDKFVRPSLSERLIFWALDHWARREFKRQWGRQPFPHFTDHRLGLIQGLFGRGTFFNLYRGFLAADAMVGKRVLDIGCGDGFMDRHLFSEVAHHVDAIDVEESAIEVARARHAAANISYSVMDATKELPPPQYDVIVWDGAIGHFRPETVDSLLRRISGALVAGGVFVGSESLGHEGTDHHQFFDTADDLEAVLRSHFPEVQVRHMSYRLPNGFLRTEAYWRAFKQ